MLSPYILLGAVLLMAGCATNPVTGGSNFVMMSESDEIATGRRAHADVVKQYGIYDDIELQAYVQQIGRTLAANSHRAGLAYQFTVLDSAEVNAFALPGGYIYITRGLLAYLNSEAELAAVLGHEIGHVTARHSVRQISMARAAGVGYAIGAILVPEVGGQAGQSLFDVLGNALISGYGRDHELESDRLGAEYLARSGYAPQAMIDVISLLKSQEEFEKQVARQEGRAPRIYHGVFASHPDNDTRLQEVVAAAGAFVEHEAQTINRDAFLRRIDGLVFGDSEDDGVVRGRQFYHHELGFALTVPEAWRIDNLSDRLIVRSPADEALLQLVVEDRADGYTAEEFLAERIGIRGFDDGEEIAVSGLEGFTATALLRRTPFGKRRGRIAVIYLDDRAFVFVGVVDDRASPEPHDAEFLAAVRSFHRLADEERPLARAQRIRIVNAGNAPAFAAFVAQSKLPRHAEEQLRLLNHYYPAGEPLPGALIKIVE